MVFMASVVSLVLVVLKVSRVSIVVPMVPVVSVAPVVPMAPVYKPMHRSAFKSGTAWEPLGISRPSLRAPQPRDVDALACFARSRRHVEGSAHAPGRTIQSIVFRLHLQRETWTNGYRNTTSMIPWVIFVFGEFSSPVFWFFSWPTHKFLTSMHHENMQPAEVKKT